jgi:hypothetical protein
MLLRLEDLTLDPSDYLHTLAVRLPLPSDWEIEAHQGIARCGVMLRGQNSRESLWLPFDERDDFYGTVLFRQPAAREDQVLSWTYLVNIWYQSREVIPWHVTLTSHPSTWHFSFGLAGSNQGVRVILPDYIPLAHPQLESVGTG